MDARKYLNITFITLESFGEGPRRVVIKQVEEGKYDKPNLVFEDHTALGLNATNLRVMGEAYGWETDDWPGLTIELFKGDVEFQDKLQPSVLIKPISPPPTAADEPTVAKPTKPTKPGKHGDMDDEIPF